MHKEIFNISGKKELWFLQTHLNNRELQKLKHEFHFYLKTKFLCDEFFKNLSQNPQRATDLLSKHQEFCEQFSKKDACVLSKYELHNLTQKEMAQGLPLAVQYCGEPNILKKPLVAIIGSRRPTFYGREQAYRFAKELSAQGCTIVSGGAIGIDSIANSVALEQAGGSCAILGSGLNHLYPPSNYSLFQQLKHSPTGLILSEFAEHETPQKWNFPKRNHTIAALADYVLVIEATLTSGSIITACAALDYGTDVGAIPGGLDSPNSEGTNSLIQKGAFCIQKPLDVLDRVHLIYQQRLTTSYVAQSPFS